ncbi:DUF7144 family membrane protein [Mycobacterium sp.]|jgi:hypothetical protein|uniref:DUF7144 family membrane protein n=1 Tax=Mycobacterium sp. TaxID=1785 RepID=UPI002D4D3CDA|nr:hypothetical protein [Mycobacterium sp.]HZA09668.1 hypothetical protein [Mycobacterium sp.]
MNPTPPAQHPPARQVFAAGATIAAGALLLTNAVLMLLEGISAVINNKLLVIGPDYAYKFNTTGWGWIHIVLAILMGIVALGLVFGRIWARVVAIVMASVSIVAMFLWLPYYPVWSVVIIALDVVVIWAVATWDRSRA